MTDHHLIDQAQDQYCHDIARIDVLGPNRRLVFTIPCIHDGRDKIVAIKLIVPAELLTKLAYMAIGAEPDTVSRELLSLETRTAN